MCLLMMTASLLVLLWLYAKNKEKNKKDAAKVLVLTGFLGLVICMAEDGRKDLAVDGRLMKDEAGGEFKQEELRLDIDGIADGYRYVVEVEPQRLQGERLEQLFSQAADQAEKEFLGENISLDRIEHPVSMPKDLQNGQIRAKWKFDPEGFIDEEGEMWDKELTEEGTLVMVSVIMSYFDEVREHTFGCLVYPMKAGSMEQLLAELSEYFKQEQEESKDKQYIRLPKQLNGIPLHWSMESENTYRILLLLGVAAAIAVFIQQGVKEQKQEQLRKERLLRQYPDMVSKLSLLLGAGMTLSGAWERIVLNYQRQVEQHQAEKAEVYEQMLLSYREIQDGAGELKVYERFGERCGTPQYRKLSMLIVQNMRKGSASLRQILEKEVTDAFVLRKNLAKKAGEEAGTKILLPMMLMLCIVMIIILVPAFLTFQM